MTPQKHKDETLRTLVDITEAAARQQPSVMLFEDAHWADPTTLEVLDLLIDRVKTVPLLVVLTHRPEFQSRWSGQGHVGALNLSKLTRTQSAAMVSALAGGKALPAALLEQILTRTDGVPLFVEELTKSILESGELKEAGDHYEYGGSARAVTIPATLRDSLMARLDRFMPVKEIAQIGAAIGREFSYELIAAVAPMPQAQLDDALARLSESGLAFRRGTPPDAVYTFKHALVQDAAYDSLLKSRRQELHAKIARVIEQRFPNIKTTEPEVLAHHLTAAGLAEAAIPLWQAAGELALKRMALTEAIAHLNQGLELVSTLPRSSERDASELGLRSLPWHRVDGAQRLGRPGSLDQPASGTCLGEVARAPRRAGAHPLGTDEQHPDARARSGVPAVGGGDAGHREGDRRCRPADHGTRSLPASATVGRASSPRLWSTPTRCWTSTTTRSIAILQTSSTTIPKLSAGIFGSISTWMLGYPDRALRLSDEKDAHARRRGHPFDLGFALTTGAHEFDHRYDARGPAQARRRM